MRLFEMVTRRGFVAPAVCCVIAASLCPNQASAQGFFRKKVKTTNETVEAGWDTEASKRKSVRLNFLTTPWAKVLNDVAKETGSTLVMHDVPPGNFSRHDWNQYNRDDAVKILNRELERVGFRILIKDQFLTVMSTRRGRLEYERPISPLPEEPGTQAAQTTEAVAPTPESEPLQAQTIPTTTDVPAPAKKPTIIQTAGVNSNYQFTTEVPRHRMLPPEVQNSPKGQSIQPLAYDQASQPESEQVEANETRTYRPRHRSPVDIARQIHKAFSSRSKLENAGPNGMPAFVVSDIAEDQAPADTLFVVEIDSEQRQLLVTATAPVQSGLKTLIQSLDINPIGAESVPTLMAGNGSTAEIAERLKRPISTIASAQQAAKAASTNERMLAQAEQPVPDPAPLGDQPANPEDSARIIGRGGLMTLSGNLKGDVTIETIPGFDLLIIRGNEGDIETVMEVISEIERMAVGSLPEIHLLKLEHVDSQSLAQLLSDVYEQLAELRSDSAQQSAAAVNVIPVVVPNAVLILAPTNTMEAILDLAAELDQPIDPTHEIQVIRLEYAVANSVVEILSDFYPDEDPTGLGTRLKVAADPRTNSVVIQARPRDLSEIEVFIKKLDADEAASISQMKVIRLKNALADELAEFLTAAFRSVTDPQASTVAQSFTSQIQGATDPKSVVLEFLSEDGEKLARSGLLDNIVFNAETRTNTLQYSASPQSIPVIEELVRILDQPSSAVAEVKYFKLQKADAVNAVELLNELFQQEETTNQNDQGQLGVQLAGATDTASSLLQLRFVADTRTNSVIATGGPDALIIAENLLYRLDATDPQNRTTQVIKLLNVPVADVALAINDFLQSQRDLATIDPDRISTSQLLEQEVIVTPEPITNSVLISATPAYFNEIEAMVRTLDAEFSQVLIQALLVEVQLDNTDEFGVELGFQDPVLFDRSIIDELLTVTETIFDPNGNPSATVTRVISQNASPGFGFNNQPIGSNPIGNPSRVGAQGLSSFALQRTNNDLGYGGLVLSASSDSVSVLIRALAARRQVRVLSRPQVLALDNQTAQIQVGQDVPVVNGVNQTNTSTSPIIVRENAGIILTVRPRISPGGQIVMEVVAEKSQFIDNGVPVFTDINTGTVITSPIKNIQTAQTTVKVPDGQTVVLGGMITDSDDILERKVPWLGDLPIIGNAFRFDSHTTERRELIIFLTPRIVHNDAESEMFKQIEAQRLHYFQEEAEELHGPIFGVPNSMTDPNAQYYEGTPQPADMSPIPESSPIPPYVEPPAPLEPAVPATGETK
ncbi:putative type II secretion system protein D precursor [Thalassoglobus neptunius]|uniref:Putative type II secretion system protein D n=1 Tax=Thalassoglobus neptunius TaxID=1938619 RepID=A0A5C5WM95_9PLAN|nr:secretin N-terminal domain-containing protein [Thalassoglobus neptunius]TWT51946.1 putative type II secretion system protein D precursor [Thalassoglobus neptunius]